jgi:hypothetical protein
VELAINYFAPHKSPGMDGIFPALLQKDGELLLFTWSRFFVPDWLLAMFQPHGISLR